MGALDAPRLIKNKQLHNLFYRLEWDITNFAMLSVHAKQILEIFKDAEAQFREREQPSGKLR